MKRNLEGEVFYCATCDGPAFANKVVAVAGGGDSGLSEALSLSEYVSKVILLEALDRCSATRLFQERAFSNPKIEIRLNTRIEAVLGDERLTALTLDDSGQMSTIEVDGLLVWIGMEPNTDYLRGTVELDKGGSVLVDYRMATPTSGIFAAGDIRHRSAMQVATAVGDGATAAIEAHRFMIENTVDVVPENGSVGKGFEKLPSLTQCVSPQNTVFNYLLFDCFRLSWSNDDLLAASIQPANYKNICGI